MASARILTDKSNEAFQRLRGAVLAGITRVTLDIQTAAQLYAPAPGSSRWPTHSTGHHRRSIASKVEDDGNGPRGTVFAQSDYGGYLENGTWKMPARPHMRPALDENQAKASAYIAAEIAKL